MSKQAKRERQRQNREAAKEAAAAAARRARLFRSLRSFAIVAVVIVAVAGIFTLIRGGDSKKSSGVSCSDKKPKQAATTKTYAAAPPMSLDSSKSYSATMQTTCGDMTIALDAAQAPQTVNSFVFLAKEGFYDGTTFHRIVKNFVDQGGDPKGTGTGGPGYTLPDEPPKVAYTKGSVAMANSGPGTSGSQFFVAVSDKGAQGLGAAPPFKYSALGQITKGMDVAQKINSFGSADEKGTPTKTIYVFKVSIVETAPSASPTSAPPAASTPAP